nr:hypothetical protein [Calditerricola satsumensis]
MKLALICSEKLPSPAIRGGAIQTMIDGVVPFLRRRHEVTIFSITDPTCPSAKSGTACATFAFPPSATWKTLPRSCATIPSMSSTC